MIALAPILIEEAESYMKGLEAGITSLLRAPVDEHSRIAARRLQSIYWLLDAAIRAQHGADVIPFLPPVTAKVRAINPELWRA